MSSIGGWLRPRLPRNMLVNDICCVVANRFASWSVASETKDVQLSDQVERLRASAMNSQVLAAKLHSEMRAAAERLNDRVDYFAKQASDEYQATSRQLMIVAATGIVERVRLVEPAGLASSSLCCTERRKSTATEALVSVLLITGEKICAALRAGQPC
jgi:hypothetical protein